MPDPKLINSSTNFTKHHDTDIDIDFFDTRPPKPDLGVAISAFPDL
jgi:hypothetical protein